MYCIQCGKEMLSEAKFCTNCGSAMVKANTSSGSRSTHNYVAVVSPVTATSRWPAYQLVVGLAGVAILVGGIYWYGDAHTKEVSAPSYKVGNAWTIQWYCTNDMKKADARIVADHCDHPVEYRIDSIATDADTPIQIQELVFSGQVNNRKGWPELWFNESDLRAKDSGYKIRFPLSPGKHWQVDTTTAYFKKQMRTYSIGQWETVTVPAGEFRVLPIVEKIENFDANDHLISEGLNQLWYSPKAGISIKTIINDRLALQLINTNR